MLNVKGLEIIKKICYTIIRPVEQRRFALENKYITASQAAEKWNISQRRVQVLCSQGRIHGVFKLGDNWAIPISATKPTDDRLKKDIKNEL